MKKNPYRTLLIFAVLAIAVIQVYPTIGWNTLSDGPEGEKAKRLERWKEEDREQLEPNYWRDTWKAVRRWSEFDRDRVINLGLDLQGGVHMVIGLDVESVWDDLKARHPKWSDSDIIYEAQLEQLRRIERRINEFEAKEPIIQALGDRQIQVQLPGEKDVERAKKIIMRAAHMTFHLLAGRDETMDVYRKIDAHHNNNFMPRLTSPGRLGEILPLRVPVDQSEMVREMLKEAEEAGDVIPEDKIVRFGPAPKQWEEEQLYTLYVLDAEPLMSGDGLQQADARPDDQYGGGRWEILFEFDAASGSKFGEVTEANIGNMMAIIVDDVVESAANIKDRITTIGVINGNFGQTEAVDLAIALNSGTMAVPITEDSTGVVGATLGEESIRKGVMSSLIGLALVVLFMAFYYRVAGLIANVALAVNALLIVGALAYFNATLTLPGIAGLILTIGMAVDANVLIYERIREEIRNGKSLLASIDSGFTRATTTILDANITTLIAAAVLMEFGTGPIEGFAVTLSIGVCSSVFTALIVARAIFDFLAGHKWFSELTMTSFLKPDTKIAFLERRRVAALVSAAVIGVGVLMVGVHWGENLGVDFRTGTNMTISLDTDQEIGDLDIRQALSDAGFQDVEAKAYGGGDEVDKNRFLLRLSREEAPLGTVTPEAVPEPAVTESTEEPVAEVAEDAEVAVAEADSAAAPDDITVSGRVQEALAGLVGGVKDNVNLEKVDTVGPAVGRQLKIDAALAIAYALVFIIAYLWFRFELKFAVGAVVALLHDVLVTVGLFAIFGRQISLPVVAAILTIIGYSLNDTIVVFDRIRESLKLYRGRGLSYPELMNISINQTLSRTLLTSVTTLVVVLVLFFFGGEVINDFAFALICGVLVGTYSSIFVASPVVYLWQHFFGKTHPHATRGGGGDAGPGGRRRRRKKNAKGGKGEASEASA